MSEEQQQSSSPTPLRVRRQGQRMTAEERKVAQETFLAYFRVEANVTVACDAVGIDRNTVYDWRKRYKDFAEQFDEAEEYANDGIDHEIYRRGVKGWLEPAISSGKWVHGDDGQPAMIPRYSDAMLTLLAKARMKKYREKQQVEMSGPDGGPIQIQRNPNLKNLSDEELEALETIAKKASGEGDSGDNA